MKKNKGFFSIIALLIAAAVIIILLSLFLKNYFKSYDQIKTIKSSDYLPGTSSIQRAKELKEQIEKSREDFP